MSVDALIYLVLNSVMLVCGLGLGVMMVRGILFHNEEHQDMKLPLTPDENRVIHLFNQAVRKSKD